MQFRQLMDVNRSKDICDAFYGLDHRPKNAQGWMYDMENMDTEMTPVLRSKKCFYESVDEVFRNQFGTFQKAVFFNGVLYRIEGNQIIKQVGKFIDRYDIAQMPEEDSKKRQMVTIGNYVLVFPDCYYINSSDTLDYGFFNTRNIGSEIKISLADKEDNFNEPQFVESDDILTVPGAWVWYRTSRTYKKWDSRNHEWKDVISTDYIRVECDGIGNNIKKGMYVVLHADGLSQYTIYEYSTQIKRDQYWRLAKESISEGLIGTRLVVEEAQPNYIILHLPGNKFENRTLRITNAVVENVVPTFDYVVESENRIWGCRFGEQKTFTDGIEDHATVNEVYSSALGDFRSWSTFEGSSADSYTATIGTGGEFTGAVSYAGKPIFFKEDAMIRIFGNYPANFQINTTKVEGVQKGMHNTIAVADGRMFYKSHGGIMVYDGSIPSKVSYVLGDTDINPEGSEVMCVGLQGKYFYCYQDRFDNKGIVYVYDARKNLWSKWTMPKPFHMSGVMATTNNVYISGSSGEKVYAMLEDDSAEPSEYENDWFFETGELGLKSNTAGAYFDVKKYISQILVRLRLLSDHKADFFIMYDSNGDWEHVYTADGGKLQTYTVPIRPKRCDHFRLRVEGRGEAEFYSIVKYIEQGSER